MQFCLIVCNFNFLTFLQEHAKRTKSLAESVHLATLQLLENKLGGNKVEQHSDQVQTDDLPPTPPPPRQEIVHYTSKIIGIFN